MPPRGVVVVYLLNGAVLPHHGADVALMVASEIVVGGLTRGTGEGAVAAVEKVFRELSVLKYEVAEILRSVARKGVRRVKVQRVAKSHRNVGHRRAVDGAHPPTVAGIDVLRCVPFSELHT